MYSVHYSLSMVAIVGLLSACKQTTDDPGAPAAGTKATPTKLAPAPVTPAPVAPPPAPACAADRTWIDAPSLPGEVPDAPDGGCGFHQFMWQSFLYLVQPTRADPKRLEFETWMPSYGIFVAKGQSPTPWGQPAPHACSKPGSDEWLFTNIINQAGAGQPLIDPAGKNVHYGLIVDRHSYDTITQCNLYRSHCASSLDRTVAGDPGIDLGKLYPTLAFPVGTIELKTAWRVVPDGDPTAKDFYTARGYIQDPTGGACELVTLGLVGLHIVSKTADHPEFVWATFEHKSNAPDCTDLDAKPPVGDRWTFFDRAACANCDTNVYRPGKPTQVCRMHPWGDPGVGITPNGSTCDTDPNQYICKPEVKQALAANTRSMVALNEAVAAMITASGSFAPVWANYVLVGDAWTRNGVLPPSYQYQQGALAAANTAMETYVQNGESGMTNPNNCFSCHNLDSGQPTDPLPPIGVSHLFSRLHPDSGGCADGKLPAACETYHP